MTTLSLLLLLGCGGDDSPADPKPVAAETHDELAAETHDELDPDPLAGLDELEALERALPDPVLPSVTARTIDLTVPERGCATFTEQAMRVWPRSGPANIVAVGTDGFVVAGYSPSAEGPEELFAIVVGPDQPPRPILRHAIEQPLSIPRTAAPGLGLIDDGHVGIATVDGSADVRYVVLQTGGRLDPWRHIGVNADQRFTPAVGLRAGRQVVAYTDGNSEGMRLRYVAMDATGRALGRHDVTPESAGGAAASMVSGSDMMLFIDPREATSTVYAADVNVEPPTADVLVPLVSIFEPALLAAAQVGDTTMVAYTAVGSAAATAVGLVTIRDGVSHGPVPLVPSSGYGMLHVSVAAAQSRAVFVADKPKGREATSPREVVVLVAEPTAQGVTFGEPLTVVTPGGEARWGRIARHQDGTYAVVLTGPGGVFVHLMRCDEG